MMVGCVIPTMNEADTIGPLVTALRAICDQVVVADNSYDHTPWSASAAGAKVVHAEGGLDNAYLFANQEINPQWWTVHVDAGGSHLPEDVTRLLDYAARYEPDITIGSRFCTGAAYEGRPVRRVMSRGAARAMNMAYGANLTDWTSGFRVYSPKARRVIRQHLFRSKGHAWQIEALWACLSDGLSVAEQPITYTAGTSHMSTGRAWEAFQLWLRVAS